MTRREYLLLSQAFADCRPGIDASMAEITQWHRDLDTVADALARVNSRFERKRFILDAKIQPRGTA